MLTRKTTLLIIALTTTWSSALFAAGTQYQIRVDGLACPFCAYGIEKKFVKTKGVDTVDILIGKGLVVVKTGPDKTFTHAQLKKMINDAGFTMKSVTHAPL